MNGEMNGLEEETKESQPSTLPTMAKTQETTERTLTDNHCDENSSNLAQYSNTSDDSNNLDHIDEDNSTGLPDTSRTGFSMNEDSRMDVDSVKESQNKGNKPNKEKTNIVPANNQCSNSSDSISTSNDGHNSVAYVNADNQKVGESDSGADEDSEDDDDSEEESTDEDGTVGSEEPRAEDTVSINSDSEPGDESMMGSQTNTKNDIIILGNIDRNGDNANGAQSPEVHEIVSDNEDDRDCVLTDEKSNSNSIGSAKESRRRNARAVNRKNYNEDEMENGDDESDIEEVSTEDPLTQSQVKNVPILVSNTKALAAIAAQQPKAGNQKKEPTVVIIDTNTIMSGKGPVSLSQARTTISSPSMSPQSLYQSIAARGTTVTPVTTKHTSAAVQTSQQPIILPSLTDDMFVVEAPSFIVPYVYEKPSIRPFKDYVLMMGEEIDREKAELEALRLQKEKAEKEMRNKERKERGEDSEKEEPEESEKKEEPEKEDVKPSPEHKVEDAGKSKKNKKNRKKGPHDEDDSWDGDSSMDSEEEAISEDDQGTTVVLKDKMDDSLENLKTSITAESMDSKPTGIKSDNYFENALGKFFTNIGLSLVQEFVQTDLLKQQKRKLHKELKMGSVNTKPTESAIISLSKNLEFSKENNAPYRFQQKKCKFCSFKSESMLVMSHHLETPHMKNNVYNCNFCSYEIKSPHDILYHMEEKHNTRGRLERAPAYHQCANCPFEDNGKGKLARHLIPCAKKFKPELNLAPPAEWEPPAKIPKIARARNSMMNNYQAAFNRAPTGTTISPRQTINMSSLMPGGVMSNYRPRGRTPVGASTRGVPPHGTPLQLRGNMMMRHNSPSQLMANYPIMQNAQGGSKSSTKMLHQPSISITPLPRAPQPAQAPAPQAKGSFVICEICDGYIKDLEQLRNHMQWIHKVKIHPKMIYNRPPLNCQKCQFRFFTDQGLERHLLGTHGLVTSSMQEAANKGKDAGRCPVCGRVYQYKLLNHVARDHNLTLKPAHLSYKCTVCTATFGMYKQFENHVYSAHSVVAKRVMDKSKSAAPVKPPTAADASQMKPLKINDEITIIPQPSRAPAPPKGKKD